jgi:hypothetical protein
VSQTFLAKLTAQKRSQVMDNVQPQRKITYEPFLFALSVIGVLYKLYESVEQRELRYDWTLAATCGVFVFACVMWLVNSRRARQSTRISANVKTGTVIDGQVVGAEATKRDEIDTKIRTDDVRRSTVIGYKEK